MNQSWTFSRAALAVGVATTILIVAPAQAQLVTSISNNKLWLDGADMNANGTFDTGVGTAPITSWNDKSGGGFHVTPPVVAGNTPLQSFSAQNGLSTGLFDRATVDKLDNTAFNVANQYTVLSVVRANFDGNLPIASESGHILSGINQNGTDAVLFRLNTGYRFYSGPGADGNVNGAVGPAALAATGFHLVGMRINNITGSNDLTLFDGVAAAGNFGGAATLNGIRIGNVDRGSPNNANQAEAWGGDIAEVVVFDKLLNTAERRILENHLAAKWATATLGANDRYQYDTAAGNNDFGVIGIGRETDGALTTSSDLGLTISEANASLANTEYVLVGTNDLTNSLVTTQLPPGVDQRWERVWAIDETGDVDVSLLFDFSDAGLAFPTDPSAFSLLQALTENGVFSVIDVPAIVVGDTVSFNVPSAQLNDGFFTLGVTAVPEPMSIALWLICGLAMGVYAMFRRRRLSCNA